MSILCVVCNSECPTNKKDTCSTECTEINRIRKIKSTKLAKYGTVGYNNRTKTQATCLERYGATSVLASVEIRNKIKDSNLAKYGVENPGQRPDVIKKIGDSIEAKFGTRSVFARRDIMEKSFESKYGEGIKNAQQIPGIAQKTLETRKEKYGDLIGAVPRESSERTCLERYGSNSFFGSEAGKMSSDNLRTKYGYTEEELNDINRSKGSCSLSWWASKYGDSEETKDRFNERLTLCDSMSWQWALNKSLGEVELAKTIYTQRHATRRPKFGMGSKASIKFFKAIESEILLLDSSISSNDIWIGDGARKERFLFDQENKRIYFYDFTILNKKIIVEYNGVYYHPKEREQNPISFDMEQRKLEVARNNGFNVFVVWDDVSFAENKSTIIKEIKKCLKM